MRILHTLLLMSALILPHTGWAHTDDYLDTLATPHGGQMRMAGAYHFELVVTPDALHIHVSDHADKAVATAGATGTAITLSAAGKQTIQLQPQQSNLLTGAGQFDPAKPLKAIITIQMPGQPPQTARFDTAKLLDKKNPPAAATQQDHSQHH